jgi:hypothetical protein
MIWSDFRTIIRRTLLADENASDRYSNNALLDSVGWALDAFCAHTAAVSSFETTGDGTTTTFTLPDNVYAPVDEAGLVYLQTDTTTRKYPIPVFKQPGALVDDEDGFYVWDQNQLVFLTAPESGATLEVFYYAFYTHPTKDADTIDAPDWALGAIAYLTASFALSNEMTKEAVQGDFRQRPDTGTPIQLPLAVLQDRWRRLYEDEIKRHTQQERRYLKRWD